MMNSFAAGIASYDLLRQHVVQCEDLGPCGHDGADIHKAAEALLRIAEISPRDPHRVEKALEFVREAVRLSSEEHAMRLKINVKVPMTLGSKDPKF